MKEMFYKYWSEYCVAFAFGCVLDLKEKFNFIRFCYKRLYPFDYKVRVDKVKDGLYDLFSEYVKQAPTPNSSRCQANFPNHPLLS